MNEHSRLSDLLPLYVSGALESEPRKALEKHLAGCGECQADLALWKAVSTEVVAADQAVSAPRGLPDRALAQARLAPRRSGAQARLGRMLQLLRSQAPLVHREIWPASALVILLGCIIALLSNQAAIIYVLAPLIAAACISLIYGPENDPAYELALSTPVSPRQILLARLALVFSYNLGLALAAMLALLPALNQPLVWSLVLTWLAPMAFLSAAALALSLWIGASNAISVTYVLWLSALLAGPLRSPLVELSPLANQALAAYQAFWQSPLLLLALAAALFAAAVWYAGRKGQGLLTPA